MLTDIELERAELLEKEQEELLNRQKSLIGKCYGCIVGGTTYCIRICNVIPSANIMLAIVVYSGEYDGIYECQCTINRNDTGFTCVESPAYANTECFEQPLAVVGDNYFFNVLLTAMRGGHLCHI